MTDDGELKSKGKRFYGKYRGMVIDNVDPMRIGRITASVADVYGELVSGWALPALPAASLESGIYALPAIGSSVWIEFEQGNPEYPIWSGGFWLLPVEVPPETALGPPTQITFRTSLGNLLMLDDELGGISLQTTVGTCIQLNATGILLKTATGAMLELNAVGVVLSTGQGESISMLPGTVLIDGTAVMINEDGLVVT